MVARADSTSDKPHVGGERSTSRHLSGDPSFWGTTLTQFFGAFNDNIFKQLLLLLVVSRAIEGEEQTDLQGVAMMIFAAPFVLLAGPSGYLSDRMSKSTIIVISKVLEIVAMVGGVVAFFYYDMLGLFGLFSVLLFMGAQSTLFAPSKYGILPELFHPTDLPQINGVFLMTTFVAIILGTVAAGIVRDLVEDELWIASLMCVAVAIAGTLTTISIRKTPPATPNARFTYETLGMPKKTRQLFFQDRSLSAAILASCMFWLCAGVVQQAVNSLGKVQLQLSDTRTSLLAGAIAVGIAVGCLVAGLMSKGQIEFRFVQIGAWGIVGCLAVLALPGSVHGHLLGFWGSIPILLLLGVFTGMFSVPIQVYLQAKAPEDQIGQVLAEMSRANWLAILFSGVLYSVFDQVLIVADLSRCYLFAFTLFLMLPIAIWYHPSSEMLEAEQG